MKKLFTLILCFLFFVIGTNSYSGDLFDKQNNNNSLLAPSVRSQLASSYFNPLSYSYQDTADVLSREQQLSMLPGYKLPKKALLLSALMPGAGELYVKSYLKAATFFLVEVGAWTFYGIYTKKGNEKEGEYEAYADEKWNSEKWISWYDGLDPSTQEQFTHTGHMLELLEEGRKTQQYYEMIGKYAEFVTGWEGTRNDLTFGELMGYRQDEVPIADDYMDMRAESNDLFSLARTGTTIAMVNHLLSAIDAAWSAKIKNNRLLKTSMRIEQKRYANHVQPVFSLKFNW